MKHFSVNQTLCFFHDLGDISSFQLQNYVYTCPNSPDIHSLYNIISRLKTWLILTQNALP
jgi:hypothetical protein